MNKHPKHQLNRSIGTLVLFFTLQVFAAERPNVILIITDDQGYGDIAAHGNPLIQTPHMDQLHAESVRFTNFHVDPTCSPTRGALLSGKYSHRAKVWHTIAGGNHLRASEETMGDVFKASGYRTAMFGKWHLGSNYPYRPMDRGFDEWLGQGDGGTGTTDDYFTNDRVNDHYLRNGKFEFRPGYAPDVFYSAAIDFIRKPSQKPFFIYLSTYIPHTPHTLADRKWADKYLADVNAKIAYFFAAIERVDHNLGRLRKALEKQDLADNTLLIFLSDNGGTEGTDFYNAGMRGKKGSIYEGGHRVPLYIHWKNGKFQHGQDVSDLTAHMDILPSLIDLLDLKTASAADFDGRSFKAQLRQPDLLLPERTLFVEKQRTFKPQKWENAVAMTRRWRLVDNKELYDIHADPGQKRNVAFNHPEVVEKLRKDFDSYWRHVSPGDRDRAVFIVGHDNDPETFLHSSDCYAEKVPWNHGTTSIGQKLWGNWVIKAATKGAYRFELRRWPKEVDAPLSGIPHLSKTVDAWDASGGKSELIYDYSKGKAFTALPIAKVKLKVGDREWIKTVNPNDTKIIYELPLDQAEYEVEATFISQTDEAITSAYYVYCSKID